MKKNDFHKLCRQSFPLILDGATGTELIKRGMPAGVCPEAWVAEHPEAICDIHNAYIAAGSNIVYAPTFGANSCKLAQFGLEDKLEELITALVSVTKKNAANRALVFGDLAPTGRFVEPFGEMPFEEAVSVYKRAAKAMKDAGADGFAIETMMDLQEARAALIGVQEAAGDMPVIVTMTFESSGRTLTGTTPEAALVALQSLGADAFGCNCSTGPVEMAQMAAKMRPYAKIPLITKPNAGLPKLENGKTVFSMNPDAFAACAKTLLESGASIIGGCCGTTPEHIAKLAKAAKSIECKLPEKSLLPVISSASDVWEIGKKFTVIGERINPTGKKALQAELREGRLDMVLDFALQQTGAGAQVLDVNMGLSGIDETKMMRSAVCALVKTVSAPLCIDSTNPATVEAALRIYPGRALLNSISAEKERLEKVLPIAARYGAFIIALPLEDQGIPAEAAERMQTVEKIIAAAEKYGYTQNDICVDALIMSVSSDPQAAKKALDLISLAAERGVNTVCGLSNISFGLPARALVNRTFLGMAMGRNLTMAIANPLFPELMQAVKAGDALYGRDENMADFIASATEEEKAAKPISTSPAEALKECIIRGMKERVTEKIDEALAAGYSAQSLLDEILIPAIMEVGKKYEEKRFFLPQLIAGAEAMSAGTEYLEKFLSNSSSTETKVPFILATVKKDIHDIGKNIVGTVLKNNGFKVIDLGKDVPPEVIIDRAVAENAELIGLSALMIDTMDQGMRDTITLAKKRGLTNLKFIVGGAVVDSEFAKEMGAVYAADPQAVVDAAKKLLEN